MTPMKKPRCPNCGHELEFVTGEWVCFECELHSKDLKKVGVV